MALGVSGCCISRIGKAIPASGYHVPRWVPHAGSGACETYNRASLDDAHAPVIYYLRLVSVWTCGLRRVAGPCRAEASHGCLCRGGTPAIGA